MLILGKAIAEIEEIKAMPAYKHSSAFRQLLRRYHPDKNGEKTEVYTEVFKYLLDFKP